MKTLVRYAKKTVMSLLLPALVFAVFTVLTGGRFSTSRMIMTTLRQSVVPALICYGIMLNMTVGMVNFSAGAAILSVSIIAGNLTQMTGTGIPGLIVLSILCGLAIGIISGALYIKMRVPAMVLTIGLMLVFEALPRVIFSNGINMSSKLTILALSPYCFIIFGIMFLLFYLLYNKTAFGHNLRAIGSNQAISDSVGINSDMSKFMTFAVGGIFIGVSALLYLSNNGEVRPVSAMASMLIMMDGFMGMFLSMFISKYCNLAFAVPISVLTMKLISNGFVALGVSATIRDVTNGLVLLILLTISANEGVFAKMKANREFAEQANAKLSASEN
jgi:ribose transport system permease protein